MRKQRMAIRIIAPTMMILLFTLFSYKLLWFAEISFELKALAALWIFLVIGTVFAMPLFFWTKPNRGESEIEITIQKIGNYAQGYFSYIFALIIFRDLLWLGTGLVGLDWVHYNAQEMVSIFLAPPVFMIIGRIIVELGPFTKEVKIEAPVGFKEKLKIVQISDLHIGPGLSLKKIQNIVKTSNAVEADFIFLTGDIVDHLDKWFLQEINTLGELRARYGVYFIPGNHEYYWGVEPILAKIRKIGIHVLINENRIVGVGKTKVCIGGVSDFAAAYFNFEPPNVEKTFLGSEGCDLRVLLAHQPKIADQVVALQVAGKIPFVHLQLSGHTHGGQFIPWSLIIRLFQKYTKGMYRFVVLRGEEKHQMNLYVNQGTGFWGPPDRFGTVPELTILRIN